MAETQSTTEAEFLALAEHYAGKTFQQSERIWECVGVAWEAWKRTPQAPVSSLVWYAAMWLRSGRQFGQTIRSVDTPYANQREKEFKYAGNHVQNFWSDRENPAELAAVRLDFRDFWKLLNAKQRRFLRWFLDGERTKDIAQRCKCSPGRVSQIRQELVELWEIFTA